MRRARTVNDKYTCFATWSYDKERKEEVRQFMRWVTSEMEPDQSVGGDGLKCLITPALSYITPQAVGQPIPEELHRLVKGRHWIELAANVELPREETAPYYTKTDRCHHMAGFWLTNESEWLFQNHGCGWKRGDHIAITWKPMVLLCGLAGTFAESAEEVIRSSDHLDHPLEENLPFGFNRLFVASLYRTAYALLPGK